MLLDDGSPDPTPMSQTATDFGTGFTRFQKNRGISAAWNALATHAFNQGAEIAVILNDDILVNDKWLLPMVYLLETNPQVGVASWQINWFNKEDAEAIILNPETGPVRDHNKVLDESRRHPNWEWSRPGKLGAPCGCCFAVTRECFMEVGGFNENMKSFFEETLFGYQAMLKGFQPRSMNGPLLWHGWAQTFGRNPELMASLRHQQSRQIFWDTLRVPENERGPKNPFLFVERTIFQPALDRPLKWWTPEGIKEQ